MRQIILSGRALSVRPVSLTDDDYHVAVLSISEYRGKDEARSQHEVYLRQAQVKYAKYLADKGYTVAVTSSEFVPTVILDGLQAGHEAGYAVGKCDLHTT